MKLSAERWSDRAPMAHSTDYSHMLLVSLKSGNDNSVGIRRFSAFLKTWKLRCPCEVRTGGWTVMESEAKLCTSLEFVGQQVRVQASPEGLLTPPANGSTLPQPLYASPPGQVPCSPCMPRLLFLLDLYVLSAFKNVFEEKCSI